VSKLSVFVAALALVLGGCAGEVEGPEEFAFMTEGGALNPLVIDAADEINAEDPTVLVTIEFATPGDPDDLVNLQAYSGPGLNPEYVGIGATAKTHVLFVGDEASVEQIKVGMRNWITMFTRREPVE
jgi:hypothetical protein